MHKLKTKEFDVVGVRPLQSILKSAEHTEKEKKLPGLKTQPIFSEAS